MPCEIYKIKKRYFINFVKDRALLTFKSNLVTLHPDWVLRKCYVNNGNWQTFKKGFITEIIDEMKIMNSKKLKYLYGN